MRMTVSLCGFDSKFVKGGKFDIIDAYKGLRGVRGWLGGRLGGRLGEVRRGEVFKLFMVKFKSCDSAS